MLIYSSCLKRFVSLSVLFFSFLLAGCLPSAVNIRQPITQETPITQDGVVVAKVINASGAVLPFNQFTITPKDVNKTKGAQYPRLLSLGDPEEVSLFASSVPAGEYTVDSVRSFYVIGEYFYSVWATGGVDLGVFNVEPGKITDLGTFIYYRKVEGDKYREMLIRIPDTNNQAFLNSYRPFLKYDSSNVLSWVDDGLNADRFSNYVALAQNPTVFTERYLSPTGSLFLLGKLGAILERKKTGEWSQEMLETNAEFNAIAQNEKGQIMVGGDQGALFFKDNKGNWKDISFDLKTKIGSIRWLPNGNANIFAVQNGRAVVLTANLASANPQWQTLFYYSAVKGWNDSRDVAMVTGDPLEKEIAEKENNSKKVQPKKSAKVKTQSVRVSAFKMESFLGHEYLRLTVQKSGYDNQFNIFDSSKPKLFSMSKDMNSISFESKMSGEMDGIIHAGATNLGIKKAGFWSWTGKDGYYRFNSQANTWAEMKTYIDNCPDAGEKVTRCQVDGKRINRKEGFNFLTTPVFKDVNNAYVLVRPYAAYGYSTEVKTYLLHTADGGNLWKKLDVELPGKFCTDIIPEINDRILLHCSGVSGDFYESIDEGKTWKHVRQHESF
jgi:hypothetical protein